MARGPAFLRRKPKVKMGVREEIKREWPRHRKYVRSHQCVVPGCERLPTECCHIRLGAHAGMKQKPGDWLTYPGCAGLDGHHAEQHTIGEVSFAKKYGLDLYQTAARLVKFTPDLTMKDYMGEHGILMPGQEPQPNRHAAPRATPGEK